MSRPRAIAIAVFRREDEILVCPVPDPDKGVTGYRPPGGSIELGEPGATTVRREMREELGADIADARYLGTVENIFRYRGKWGHEIVRVYETSFSDRRFYERSEIELIEETGERALCVWWRLAAFGPDAPLYPDGLSALLGSDMPPSPSRHALGAAAVIRDRVGHVLLAHHTYGALNWELPGGASEPRESAAETAVREVLEETGLSVEIEALTGVYWEPAWGAGVGMHHFVFRCRAFDDVSPRADAKEVSECAFWPIDALPRPISDFTVRRIRDALAGDRPALVTIEERHWLP